MADIELVIKIPEEEYRWIIKSDETVFADVASKECMMHAIKNGTPLPKGHGRLVDGDALWNKMSCYSDDEGAGVDYSNDDVNPIILRDSAMEVIENAPTIIPADKEVD